MADEGEDTTRKLSQEISKISLSSEGSHFGIREFRFQRLVLDVSVCIQCLAMNRSFFFWVGTAGGSFENLDLAMAISAESLPVSSVLLGNSSDTIGAALSQRLSMKLGTQVFVSYNLPSSHSSLLAETERLIFKEVLPALTASVAASS
jgi:hypothetical protein